MPQHVNGRWVSGAGNFARHVANTRQENSRLRHANAVLQARLARQAQIIAQLRQRLARREAHS